MKDLKLYYPADVEDYVQKRGKYKTAQAHMHTLDSDGTRSGPRLLERAQMAGIGTLIITDHDKVGPSIALAEYAEKHNHHKGLDGIDVKTGVEISTKGGRHVLGLGIQKDIDKGLSSAETIRLIHEQGGVAIIPHPGIPDEKMPGFSLPFEEIESLMQGEDASTHPDGIEILNGSVLIAESLPIAREQIPPGSNERATNFLIDYNRSHEKN